MPFSLHIGVQQRSFNSILVERLSFKCMKCIVLFNRPLLLKAKHLKEAKIETGALPFPSLPFPSLPFPSLPFPSLPFPSLPFPSLPFPSLPFPALWKREQKGKYRERPGVVCVLSSLEKFPKSPLFPIILFECFRKQNDELFPGSLKDPYFPRNICLCSHVRINKYCKSPCSLQPPWGISIYL